MLGHATLALFAALLQVVSSTDRPIIGILAQEEPGNDTLTLISASYVKAVESSGARVVPVFTGRSPSYYRDLMHKLNGLVYPGGSAPVGTKGGYFHTVNVTYSIAKEMYSSGINFPILGVCQGMEALAVASNNMDPAILDPCKGMGHAFLPLKFKPWFRNYSLYEKASQEIIDILRTKNVTPNFHMFCIRPDRRLLDPWVTLSVNKDGKGEEFISSMQYGPFVGIQFHPEKISFEWFQGLPHDGEAVMVGRFFYDWLVAEARKNQQGFPSAQEEQALLIYNYSPEYTGRAHPDIEQTYIFSKNAILP